MAAELKEELSVESHLIEGSRGIFDITVDGKLVFSKFQTHKFPEKGEALSAVRSA